MLSSFFYFSIEVKKINPDLQEDIFLLVMKHSLLKLIPFMTLFFIFTYFLSNYFTKSIQRISNKIIKIGSKIKGNDSNSIDEALEQINDNLDSSFRKLKLEINKNSTLLQSISDGILAIDQSFQILFQNIRFNRIFNYYKISDNKIENLVGKEIHDLYLETLETGEEQRTYNYEIDNKIIDIKVSPIKASTDKVIGAIGVFRDTTKIYQGQKMKSEFVTNISHELKTPLTSIKGFSELLLENSSKLDESDRKYLNKIIKNSHRLIDIYDNLLTLSKIESKSNFNKENFDLKKHTSDIFNSLESKFKKESSLVFQLDFKNIYVNNKLFLQVLYNLIENSFKYSKNSLIIKVELYEEQNNYIIKFSDNGIGIPEDKIKKVFQRFYRVSESRSDNIEGSGIGLAIVKHIVEKHKGSITVKSDEGSVFTIIIPK